MIELVRVGTSGRVTVADDDEEELELADKVSKEEEVALEALLSVALLVVEMVTVSLPENVDEADCELLAVGIEVVLLVRVAEGEADSLALKVKVLESESRLEMVLEPEAVEVTVAEAVSADVNELEPLNEPAADAVEEDDCVPVPDADPLSPLELDDDEEGELLEDVELDGEAELEAEAVADSRDVSVALEVEVVVPVLDGVLV